MKDIIANAWLTKPYTLDRNFGDVFELWWLGTRMIPREYVTALNLT
jgi:hypothetical protein